MNYKVAVQKTPRGFFEMHPSEAAIFVKYQVQAMVFRPDGSEVASGKKDATKLIHFTNLADATDLKRVARDTISKCSYLDPARIDELEQILSAIRIRQKQSLMNRPGSALRPLTATPIRRSKTEAKISDLSQYRSLLYNSMEEKILGSEMILQLCQKKIYMPQILRSDAIISGLSRLLFENETRNLDLKINITRIFATLSQLSAAPALFTKNRIGGTLLQEINIEQQRYQKWKDELSNRQSTAKGDTADMETFRRKVVQMIRRQDLFISAAFEVLLVLARDVSTQTKMVKKDIIPVLCTCGERTNPDLQTTSLRFLLMLSVYVENMDKFIQAGSVEKIGRILDHQRSPTVCGLVLKLLFNLSLCPSLRKAMIKKNVVKKLLPLLEIPQHTALTARVLYSISMAKRNRRDMITPELASALAREIARSADNGPDLYLLALAINVLSNPTAATSFVKCASVKSLLDTAVKNENTMLLKVVNLAVKYAEDKPSDVKNFAQLIEQIKASSISAFTLESFHILTTALECHILPIDDFMRHYKVDIELIGKCQSCEQPPEILTITVFMGALAVFDETVKILTEASMTDWMCQKLADTEHIQEEIAIQMGYTVLKFIQYEPARQRVMNYPGITKILSERTQESSDVGRALFEELLFHLSSVNEEIHEAWKMERFQQYNGQWLRAIETRREEGGDGNMYMDDFNDDEMDLVTRFGLNDLSDEMEDDEDDVEDMIERYSARSQSRLSLR